MESAALSQEQRNRMFNAIWRDTHKDFRGAMPDGTKSLMSNAKFGGGLVSATTITDAELIERAQ